MTKLSQNDPLSSVFMTEVIPVLDAISARLGLQFVMTSFIHDMAGHPRVDAEHIKGRALDVAVVLPKGINVSGIRGYNKSGRSPRFSTDFLFISSLYDIYHELVIRRSFPMSILIEHDHLHCVYPDAPALWLQSGVSGDVTPLVFGINAERLIPLLKMREFKPIIR